MALASAALLGAFALIQVTYQTATIHAPAFRARGTILRDSGFRRLPLGLLRAPAYSVDRITNLQDSDAALRERLGELFCDPYAREAISYSAPHIFGRHGAGADIKSAELDDLPTLLKYANRLCFRATPSGLAATACTLTTEARPVLPVIAPRNEVRLRADLDQQVFQDLVVAKASDAHAQGVEWIANDTVYTLGNKLRFIKLGAIVGEGAKPILSSVESSKYLVAALEFARTTPKTLAATAAHLAATFPSELRDGALLSKYLESMVEQQLLTRDHLLALTDSHAAWSEIARLHGGKSIALSRAVAGIASSETSLAAGLAAVRACAVGVLPGLPARDVIRVHAWRDVSSDAGLPAAVLAKMDQTVAAVVKMLRPRPTPFEGLLKRWDELYGDADLPLMMLVDEASGLYKESTHGVRGIFGEIPRPRIAPSSGRRPIRHRLFEQYLAGADEIDVSSDEIEQSPVIGVPPRTATGWFRLWTDALGALQLEMTALSTWPAGRIMGRFALDDERIAAMLREDSATGCPDSLVAELVWHTRTRSANICRRPVLAEYEVTIRTGAAKSLPVSDILVCRQGRSLRLRSKSLGKWIDLRMSTAHNHELPSNLPLYRFLNELIVQHAYSLDDALPRKHLLDAPKTPRIKLDGVILAPTTYRLPAPLLDCLRSAAADNVARRCVDDFRERHGVPALVVHAEDDKQMLVRLDGMLGIHYLRSVVRRDGECLLMEFAPAGLRPALMGEDGAYNHEILVHYVTNAREEIGRTAHRVAVESSGDQVIASELFDALDWLYCTFTVKPVFQDAFLVRFWDGIVQALREESIVDLAFFVRYTGPAGPTLRVRLHLSDKSALASATARVHAWWLRERPRGECLDLRNQVYAPEINRYGGASGLQVAHRLFSLNSDWVIDLIRSVADMKVSAFLSVNTMLHGMGWDLAQRKDFARRHARSLGSEYHIGKLLRQEIERAAKSTSRVLPGLHLEDFHVRRLRSGHAIAAHLQGMDGATLCEGIDTIASHVIHMNFNRLFSQEPRAQEAQTWDVIRRMYEIPSLASTIADLDERIAGGAPCLASRHAGTKRER